MEIDVIEDKENKLLHRREVRVSVKDYGATPSREELISSISAKLGVDKENLVLDRADQQFGKKETLCYVKIYDNSKLRETYELKYKIKRMTREKKKPEEVKVEEKPKEEPVEEKKEEEAEEEKPKEEPKAEEPKEEPKSEEETK